MKTKAEITKQQFASAQRRETLEYKRRRAADDARIEAMGGFVRVKRVIGADDPRYDNPEYVRQRIANPRR